MTEQHLEFEKEMFLNVLHENSLTITSKGIANDRLLVNLVKTFSCPYHLVLVIGAEIEEEDSVISQVTQLNRNQSPEVAEDEDFIPPKRISAESMAATSRRDIYLSGGVIFITTRILVVDMLTKRLPFESVSGIIVANAHRVIKDCHLSFILRLFRMNNKSGFITALSQTASAFLGAFAKLERIMRNLFVTKLFLWPRFHALISSSFASRQSPNVVEFRVDMTSQMKQVQFALIDLISLAIKELTSLNSFIFSSSHDMEDKDDENALNTINVISQGLNKIVRAHLDSVWFQLSPKARRLIRDIRLLKSLLFHLTELDAVTFYAELKHIRDNFDPTDKNASEWMFWPPTDSLFKVSQERVFRKSEDDKMRVYNIEINPKLDSLNDLLNEIEETYRNTIKEKRMRLDSNNDDDNATESKDLIDIIIVVENRYSIRQIENFRDKGKSVILEDLKSKCELLSDGKKMTVLREQQKEKKISKFSEESIVDFEEQLTLTQMFGQFECEEENITRKHNCLQLHYFEWSADNTFAICLKNLLISLRPRHIILYEPEMSCIRQIELYQALYADIDKDPINVYFCIFDGSAEEQRYLRNLQVEKESFEALIEEKSKLANVKDGDGLSGHHPDLVRGSQTLLHPEEEEANKGNSRIGGGGQVGEGNKIRQVLVDLREFRSQLPACVHKLDIELEPVVLEIGDYLLTPDTCLERKSISDLIGSLAGGRLYSQAQMMTRYYKRPLLLIEFEESKSFNFKARYWSSAQAGAFPARPSPLVQLAVLTIHFPLLRIIWSPSPNFSAEIIDQLKQGKEEPSKENDLIRLHTVNESSTSLTTIGGKELPFEYFTDRYDIEIKEFLLSLPGVTTGNVYAIMNRVESLVALVDIDIEELTEIMSSSLHANLLHRALHSKLVADTEMENSSSKTNAKKRFAHVRKKPTK